MGLLVGAAVGLAIYHGSLLSGRNLFILCGATAGGVAAIIVHGYGRTVRLTDMSISVPQLSELHFAITKDNQQVAWKLFVESATRVSVQPLDEGCGIAREALASLYGLFNTTREILKESNPSQHVSSGRPTVEHLAIAMLNTELRPFLSRWHPILSRWEASHPGGQEVWPEDAVCRDELAAMQGRLRTYVLSFGKLAGVPDVGQILEGALTAERTPEGGLHRSPGKGSNQTNRLHP